MSVWSEGYVTDTAYEAKFFTDLTPSFLRMALLLHGEDMPRRKKNEPLRYLELGYGQGLSLNVHSAAVDGEFWGTDFNPDHTLRASEMAQAAGLDPQLLNISFAELDARSSHGDLPLFDIIALHGVWSWISDENRQHILNIIHRNLKMGGVVYISYNTLPGWAPFMPVRDLLAMHADTLGNAAQDSSARIQQAYAFARQLAAAKAGYFMANPQATAKLEQLEGKSLSYLTHEYMNSHSRPFYFADVAAALGRAKCTFVSSTRFISQLDVCLPADCLPLLHNAASPVLRETLRDYSLNQAFRADIFIKGSSRLSQREHMTRMGAFRVALACQLEVINLSIMSPRGEMTLKEEVYRPLLAALADKAYTPKTLEQLEDHPLLEAMSSAVLLEGLTVLAGAGYVHPACKAAAAQHKKCAQLNRILCERARMGEDLPVLASPVLAGGLRSTRIEQLFLLSIAEGGEKPSLWAEDALNVLSSRGEQLLREGKALEPADALNEMTTLAESFAAERLPYLQAMGIVPTQLKALPPEQPSPLTEKK
ncbi:MAG: class I SAM-dependent methyltransferase [Desulfovibrionaceae bacterium]